MVELKIIRDAHLSEWVQCHLCKSEMTVEHDDWEIGMFGGFNQAKEKEYIECPNCNVTILKDDL